MQQQGVVWVKGQRTLNGDVASLDTRAAAVAAAAVVVAAATVVAAMTVVAAAATDM